MDLLSQLPPSPARALDLINLCHLRNLWIASEVLQQALMSVLPGHRLLDALRLFLGQWNRFGHRMGFECEHHR